MTEDLYKTVYGVSDETGEVVEVQARLVPAHWLVKQGHVLTVVDLEKLSETREGAEARQRMWKEKAGG